MRQPPKKKSLEEIFGQTPAQPTRQPLDSIFAEPTPTPTPAAPPAAAPVPTQRIRAAAQGLTLGLSDEAEAALRSLLPGQTYESAVQDVRGKLAAYRQDRPLEALAYEVGGGLATGVAGGARALAATAGRAGMREALKAGARAATTSAVGQGVISGAASAEGGVENRLRGAAVGGGLAVALPFAVSRATRLPGVRQVTEGAGTLYDMARRGAADVMEGTPLQALGRAIEPTDATRVARIARGSLPTGPTAGSLAEETARARSAVRATQTAKTAATQQARERSQSVLDQAQSAAERVVQQGRTGVQGAGRAMQQTIRNIQRAEGDASYDLVRQFGAPPDPDPEVYREIFSDQVLRGALNNAVSAIRKEARNAAPGAPAMAPMRTINLDGEEVPELTLEVMDRMRREVMAPQMRKGAETVGLSRSQKAQALDTISRLEDRYLAGFGSDEAAQALRTARSQYRQRFKELEALQSGMNLGAFGKGRPSGLLAANKRDLDELAKSVQTMSPEEQAAFNVGARDWFDRVAQSNSGDALKLARKFATEEGQQRARLIFGEEMAAGFQEFARSAVAQQRRAAAAPFRAEAERLGQMLSQQREAARGSAQMARMARAVEGIAQPGESGLAASQTFIESFFPQMTASNLQLATGISGGAVRRQIQGMAERGAAPNEIMARIEQMQRDPALRQLLLPQLQTLQRNLTPTIGTRTPQAIRPAVSGALGRMLGVNYNE